MNKYFNNNSVFGVFGLNIINSLILASVFIYIANYSGPENFGIFTFLFTLASFPPIFAGLGSENVLIMYSSRNIYDLPHFFGNAIAIRLIVSFLIIVVFLIICIFIEYDFKYLLVLSFLSSLLNGFFVSLYISVYRIIGLHIKSVLYVLMGTILFSIFILMIPKSRMIPSYIILALLVSNIFVFIIFTVNLLKRVKPIFSYKLFKKYRTLGLKFSTSQIFDLFFQKSDIIFLNIFAGGLLVGLYSASNRIISLFVILPSALQFVFLQDFHKSSNNHDELKENFNKLLYIIIEFSLIFIGFVYWNSSSIISTIYSEIYYESQIVLKLLSIAFIINFIGYPYSMQAEALGLVGDRLRIRIYSLLFMLVSLITLVPKYNIIGAAFSLILGNLIFTLQLHFAEYKSFKINYNWLSYLIKIFILFLLTGLIISTLNRYLFFNNMIKICLIFFVHILIISIINYKFKIFKSLNYF